MREEGLGLGFLEGLFLTHLRNSQSGTIKVHSWLGDRLEGQEQKSSWTSLVFTMGSWPYVREALLSDHTLSAPDTLRLVVVTELVIRTTRRRF